VQVFEAYVTVGENVPALTPFAIFALAAACGAAGAIVRARRR